jgi:hypothetical protein
LSKQAFHLQNNPRSPSLKPKFSLDPLIDNRAPSSRRLAARDCAEFNAVLNAAKTSRASDLASPVSSSAAMLPIHRFSTQVPSTLLLLLKKRFEKRKATELPRRYLRLHCLILLRLGEIRSKSAARATRSVDSPLVRAEGGKLR